MDHSRLSTFQTCPERYRLHYVEGLRKITEGPLESPREFGRAIHAALAVYYRTGKEPEARAAFLKAYPAPLDPADLARTPENGLLLLQDYWGQYRTVDAGWKVLAVEVHEQVELGMAQLWEVKMDLVIENEQGVWGVDHKTTASTFREQYWRQFDPNGQISGYTYYLTKKYGQCSGMIVNGIRMGFRKRAYQGEPAGFYAEFQRQIFNRTGRQLEDWKRNTQAATARLEATTVWEKNEGACVYCEYQELCRSVNDEQVRETLYERGDPLAYLKEDQTG